MHFSKGIIKFIIVTFSSLFISLATPVIATRCCRPCTFANHSETKYWPTKPSPRRRRHYSPVWQTSSTAWQRRRRKLVLLHPRSSLPNYEKKMVSLENGEKLVFEGQKLWQENVTLLGTMSLIIYISLMKSSFYLFIYFFETLIFYCGRTMFCSQNCI